MVIVVHENPVLRNEANYIARIWLAPFGLEGQYEQVWLRRREDGLAEMCCIPFCFYGISLRDVVRVAWQDSTVTEVMQRSGRRVLRALLVQEMTEEQVAKVVVETEALCAAAGLLIEWNGNRHVAIDIPPDIDASSVFAYLGEHEKSGRLYWEWSDVEEFRA
ncbi:DUF4265 domain-containing protein [Kribbella yunnanensis]